MTIRHGKTTKYLVIAVAESKNDDSTCLCGMLT
jgi:hypothetical protein